MEFKDVTIIGAGLAGLFLANQLAKQGLSVLLVDRKKDLEKGVHTTGIFVRKTFEDFGFPEGTLGKAISRVSLYSPAMKRLDLESGIPEFRVGKMGLLYKTLLNECTRHGVGYMSGTRYLGAKESEGDRETSVVSVEKNTKRLTFKTKVLVGADGAASKVAGDLGLDQNRHFIVGYEEVFKGVPLAGEPTLHCFLDCRLAPGYLAWISNDGEEVHVGVGGYPSRFDPREALRVFKRFKVSRIIDTSNARIVETRGGRIPVGGVLRKIANRRGLLIGDAAGAVSPFTAGGLDPCLRLSKFAAEIVKDRIETGRAERLLDYSGSMFRSNFRTRLLMRLAFRANRSQFVLESGFRCLEKGIGRRFAEKTFFRRASFPDFDLTTQRHLGTEPQ